ncbi:FtsX-like permease family protein [Kocuria varians]|uniref:FtsX-like permease family protein n=1 Tax=Kocuria varians TaxID=1272 RepID=UPI000838BC1F|nr:FtsX-like permease family protein [Kocuria varians]
MNPVLVATRALLRSRDRATSVLTVLAFALPHAVLLAVVGGVGAFVSRLHAPSNELMATSFHLLLALFAAILLVVPALSMGAAAARLGLSRRARDLAVLRLLGLPPGSTKAASVLETTMNAMVGVVLGSVLYVVTLPVWHLVSFQRAPMGVHEMWMGPWLLLGLGALMVALGAVSAWLSLRRVAVTPLGVARRSEAHRVSPVGAVVTVVLVVVWIGPAQMLMGMGTAVAAGMLLGFLAVVFALTTVVGTWLIEVLGRIMTRTARRPRLLLAGRRIMDDPRSVWRSFGAVAMVGFVVGVLDPLLQVVGMGDAGTAAGSDDAVMMADISTGMLLTLGITFVLAAISTAVNQSIRTIDGIAETRALTDMGAPARFLDASRRAEVGIPAVLVTMGSLGMGLLFISPVMVSQNLWGAVVGLVAFMLVGLGLVLLGSEATRPLRRRLLAAT